MSDYFEGLCLGGPFAGKTMRHRDPAQRVVEPVNAPTYGGDKGIDNTKMRAGTYTHTTLPSDLPDMPTGVWVYNARPGLERADAVLFLMAFYLRRCQLDAGVRTRKG